MLRAVVFHHDQSVREGLVDAFRNAGFITYDAADPPRAFRAVWTYRPQVVITDYPAVLDEAQAGRRTLTHAIRAEPALRDVAIVNLFENDSVVREASAAGVTKSIPASTPVRDVIATVQEVSRHADLR